MKGLRSRYFLRPTFAIFLEPLFVNLTSCMTRISGALVRRTVCVVLGFVAHFPQSLPVTMKSAKVFVRSSFWRVAASSIWTNRCLCGLNLWLESLQFGQTIVSTSSWWKSTWTVLATLTNLATLEQAPIQITYSGLSSCKAPSKEIKNSCASCCFVQLQSEELSTMYIC